MGHIVTVLGPIPPAELGPCHSHDHLSLARGTSHTVNPALCIDDTARTLEELSEFWAASGRAVADAQPVGCGREALCLVELARKSGVHILAATGFHELQFYPSGHWIFTLPEAALTELFFQELTEGMYVGCDAAPPVLHTTARAGFVKAALTSRFEGRYLALFSAAVRAARTTCAPLMIHCGLGSNPVALSDFLCASGLAPRRVVFCHMDRTEPDLAVHQVLCRRGHYLEYDTIARPKYHSDADESDLILTMLANGCGTQLLVGMDSTRARLKSYGGTPGLGYLLRDFIPRLHSGGADLRQTRALLCENPARFFER